jgi:hypothetical protein
VRAELGGQLPPHRLDRLESGLEPSEVVVAHRVARAAERQDDARSLPDHVTGGGPRGQERGPHGGHDRPHVVVERIDLGRLGRPTRGADLLGHVVKGAQGAAGEEDPCALTRERPRDRTTDRAAASVDHR